MELNMYCKDTSYLNGGGPPQTSLMSTVRDCIPRTANRPPIGRIVASTACSCALFVLVAIATIFAVGVAAVAVGDATVPSPACEC